jgi:hypothetical protein
MADDEFLFDLRGRVRNLGFAPSAMNALFPLFEAVANGLHAIEERFDRNAAEKGRLQVRVLRVENDDENAQIVGFTVSDNGIGLDEDHWRAFRTADTPLKLARGGKGVGRLAWLKVFQNTKVLSVFSQSPDAKLQRRSFEFNLNGDASNPIKDYNSGAAEEQAERGTVVSLNPFQLPYDVHCPRKLDTIASHLVGHFLKHFVAHEAPSFVLVDGSDTLNLTDFYKENVVSEQASSSTIELDGDQVELDEFHVLLRKSLRFHDSGKHFLVYVGDGRVVKQQNIDNQLGISYVGPDRDCIYIGLISSKYLDTHVNQERTRFTFSDDAFESVHKTAISAAKDYLSVYIEEVRTKQAEITLNVIRENPMFLSVTDDVNTYVRENLALGVQRDEDIYLELSRSRRRLSREIKRDISKLAQSSGEELEQNVKRITDALNNEKKGSLAAYVAQRKVILDLLDSSLAYADPETRNYLKEERVHNLIIPIRTDSADLNYEDHNLWILDDRLAFYSFFKSDKPFSTFLSDSDSGKESDLAVVFDRSLAFDREGNNEPIVVVEFKRPGRTAYSPSDNPITQILNYVKIMRQGGSFIDREGKVRKSIPLSTRFNCYVVADFTDQLINILETSVAQHRSADGEGFFGYSAPHNAFIEVLPYSKLVHDARLRNEAFFAKLGLQ